jgi:hypothetical protein
MSDIKIDLPLPQSNTTTANDVITAVDKAMSQLKDFKASVGAPYSDKPDLIIKEQRRPLAGVIPYGSKTKSPELGRRGVFNRPFHDLSEIARAIDTESYLARSVQKHREYALKEGWTISGKNPETVAYVRQRLMEFEMISSVTTEEVIRELTTNLISYHTALLILNREPGKSTGRAIRLHGKTLDPVSALFCMDPTSVQVAQNGSGRAIAWKQEAEGESVEFDADDVVCITIDKKSGFIFGTPYCVPVLDDIRALRRLEELVELVSHKHLFPLFHYKVGNDTHPAGQVETIHGTLIDEIEFVKQQVGDMPTEGGIVTSERHEITFIGANGQVLDLQPYIEHFEQRVMGGLRLSGIDLGRGDTSNRATAGVINKNLMEAVKDYQQVLTDQITSKLLNLLVLEGGFDLNEENRVIFKFPPIDREEMRAHEQHGLTLWNSNVITLEEFRREYLNKEPLTEDQIKNETLQGLFTVPMTEKEGEINAKVKSVGGASKDSKSKKLNANMTRPTNQYGKSATKPRIAKNDTLHEEIRLCWINARLAINRDDGLDNTDFVINNFINESYAKSKTIVTQIINDGAEDANERTCVRTVVPTSLADVFLTKVVKSDLQKISRRVIILLKNAKDNATITATFDTVFVEMSQAIKRFQDGAYRFGFAEASRMAGYDRILVKEGDNVVKTIHLDGMSIKDVSFDSKDETYVEIDETSKI